MKLLSFDVESNGLHGQAFAIGGVVTDDNGLIEIFSARCPIQGDVDPWVAANVLPVIEDMSETHDSYEAMCDAFYKFIMEHKDAKVLTFIPWPVESSVLSDIFSSAESRRYEGPFPVLDLATVLEVKGYNSTSDDEFISAHGLKVPFNGSGHIPIFDAHAAEVIFRYLMQPYYVGVVSWDIL